MGDERMKIKGSTDGKSYQLRATCYYDPTDSEGMNCRVPPYSYFFSGGNLKFNGATGSKQTKGFSFYLQIVESEPVETANIITRKYASFRHSSFRSEYGGAQNVPHQSTYRR